MVHTLTIQPGARQPDGTPPNGTRPCAHPRHVGVCPSCQRTQLARWASQLADVTHTQNKR